MTFYECSCYERHTKPRGSCGNNHETRVVGWSAAGVSMGGSSSREVEDDDQEYYGIRVRKIHVQYRA